MEECFVREVDPLGKMDEIFLPDILLCGRGRSYEVISCVYGVTAVEFVIFRPVSLVWCVELSVVRVADEEVNKDFAVLKGKGVVV